MKKYSKYTVLFVATSWLVLVLIAWFLPKEELSLSERRKLKQIPKLSVQNLLTAKFMNEFETYGQDQFPKRMELRALKAYTRFYGLGQKDNNDIYIEEGFAVKLEYPLNENSIVYAGKKFQYLYDTYMTDKSMNVYLSVIPDKGYYLSEKYGYPSMDYDKLIQILREHTEFASYIDITGILGIDDYYKTDIHWKQENLLKVAKAMKDEMGIPYIEAEYRVTELEDPFYGVYYGQSALPLQPDTMKYLTNDILEASSVYHEENQKTLPVYDKEKQQGNDPYDLYLSGASPLLYITNPSYEGTKELIVFRDSFGSSIAPLLIDSYSRITLIDIRYIVSDYIGQFVEFEDQDVLFLYSTPVLNSSIMLK